MRFWRRLDGDRVSGPDFAACQDNCHDACLPNERPLLIALQDRRQQPGLEVVRLETRIAQARDFDHGGGAQLQPRPGWQSQQIHPTCGDILAHLPGDCGETGSVERIMEFSVDQADLTQVGLGRVMRHPRAMLDPLTAMGVALYPPSPVRSRTLP